MGPSNPLESSAADLRESVGGVGGSSSDADIAAGGTDQASESDKGALCAWVVRAGDSPASVTHVTWAHRFAQRTGRFGRPPIEAEAMFFYPIFMGRFIMVRNGC
jgi:hypothetical protein